jgi:UDP-N-acetylmuramoyl-L-alanyl-D-glutamate--2,6-diaminopimelate ligase
MAAKSIAGLLGALPLQTLHPQGAGAADLPPVTGIAYRSDAVQPGDTFFCIPGLIHDGHDFAAVAARRGAALLVVQRPLALEVPQVQVADARLALALASQAFFDDPASRLQVVAVTGTNGKTTTTFLVDWIIRSVLAARGAANADAKTGLIGTVETRIGRRRLNSHHTTPESYELQGLLRTMLDSGVSHVTMEASSHAIALDRMAGMRVAVAAFTNLTQDHLDFHSDMQDYFDTKARLFSSELTQARVINIDSPYGRTLAERCHIAGRDVLTVGFASDADLRAERVRFSASGTELSIQIPEGSYEFDYPLIGAFNVENVLIAMGIARCLGFDYPEIFAALRAAPQTPGRLERVSARIDASDPLTASLKVFVDYSHTPDAIEKALAALSALKAARVGIVFGCGGDRDRGKRPLMGQAARAADFVVVTSDNPRTEDPDAIISDILPGLSGYAELTVEPDRREAIRLALEQAEADDIILIAGKGHEDYQLVGDKILSFDDRIVAAEELDALGKRRAKTYRERER